MGSPERSDADLPPIPSEFAQYAEEIRATARKTVGLKLTPATDMELWQSKVGGEPYLPLSEEYPSTDEGRPLMLLAQINFAEMPHLPAFPEKGILQFYIDAYDEDMHMGCNFDDPLDQDKYRVLYFRNVEEDVSKLHQDTGKYQDRTSEVVDVPLQDNTNYSVTFSTESHYLEPMDYRFDEMSFAEDDDLIHAYAHTFPQGGHRIGGHAHFTQTDFRERLPEFQGYELLFQLDTEHYMHRGVFIRWGMGGVGGFFIRPEDLRKRDFSKAVYNWDCP